jgi:hypothetical protein
VIAVSLVTFAVALPCAAQTTTTYSTTYTKPLPETVPTPPPVVREPPVVTLPNPPPRMAPDRVPDMRDINPIGRAALPREAGVTPRKLVLNRLENRSTTARATDVPGSYTASPAVKGQASGLLESAKPIL